MKNMSKWARLLGAVAVYLLGNLLALHMPGGYFHGGGYFREMGYAVAPYMVFSVTYVLIGFLWGWGPGKTEKTGTRWWVMLLLGLGLAGLLLFFGLPLSQGQYAFQFFMESHSNIFFGLVIGYFMAKEICRGKAGGQISQPDKDL